MRITEVFRQHNGALVRFLRARLGSDVDAQEVAQEAYMRLLQSQARPEPALLKAYLFRIAINAATDHLRRRASQSWLVPDEGFEGAEAALQERALSARQELKIVSEALSELPPKCRMALMMSRHDGLASSEIASQLGVSDRMVRMYVVRALEHVQSALIRAHG